jgi:hypothetical protein
MFGVGSARIFFSSLAVVLVVTLVLNIHFLTFSQRAKPAKGSKMDLLNAASAEDKDTPNILVVGRDGRDKPHFLNNSTFCIASCYLFEELYLWNAKGYLNGASDIEAYLT